MFNAIILCRYYNHHCCRSSWRGRGCTDNNHRLHHNTAMCNTDRQKKEVRRESNIFVLWYFVFIQTLRCHRKSQQNSKNGDKAISLTSFSKGAHSSEGSGRHHYQPDPVAQQQNPSPPEYLDVIDQSAVLAPEGTYMEIDTSRHSNTAQNITVDGQYSYAQRDRLGNRPPLPVPTGDSHYY